METIGLQVTPRIGNRVSVYRKSSDTTLTVPLGFHSTVLQTEIAGILHTAYFAGTQSAGLWPQQEHPQLLRWQSGHQDIRRVSDHLDAALGMLRSIK